MGVKNFWKLLNTSAKKESIQGKTLAIDTSIWMHHYKTLDDASIVFSVARKIFTILYNKIRPVFVFDGTPPAAKKAVLEERKRKELKTLLKGIAENRKCSKCGEFLKVCRHINDFDGQELNNLNEEAMRLLSNHNYNWGELSEDSEPHQQISFIVQKSEKTDNSIRYCDKSIADFDQKSIENLSKEKKLERLLELREKRKLPMPCDNTDFSSFCVSQLENVKKRNKITTLIRGLSKNEKAKIQSDWTSYSEFKKEETKDSLKESSSAETKASNSICNGTTFNNEDDIEVLFEEYKTDNEWNDVFEKYQGNKAHNGDIEKQVLVNKLALESFTDTSSFDMNSKTSTFDVSKGNETDIIMSNDINTTLSNALASSEDSSFTTSLDCDSAIFSEDSESFDNYINALLDQITPENKQIKKFIPIPSSEGPYGDLRRIQNLIIEVLKAFELPYIESIGESDSQCGYLFKKGLIDGVITEDNDILIQGAKVFKNFFRKDKEILSVSYSDVLENLKIDFNGLLKIVYLLGSDYCLGIKGVGPKTVLNKLDAVREDEVAFLKKIYQDENVLEIKSLDFGVLNFTRIKTFLLKKGLNISKVDELMLYCDKVLNAYKE
ncbi:DNA repair protein rad2 [Glugoides intestinalis]